MNNELHLPSSADELTERLRFLHEKRRNLKNERWKINQENRRSLTFEERSKVLEKTKGHCHLCGGDVNENADGELLKEQKFVVDHIVPYVSGGSDSLDNFLPAHGLCNGSRWFYSPEEFQWILRMGIWARKQMEDRKTRIGKEMREPFLKNEEAVRRRRKRRLED